MKEEEVQEFKEWATSSFWSRWIEFLTHLHIMIRTDSNPGKNYAQWLWTLKNTDQNTQFLLVLSAWIEYYMDRYCYGITFTCDRYLQICRDHSPCWPSVRCVNTLYIESWSTLRSVNRLTARAPLPESSCPAAARRAPGAGRRNHCARALS